MKTIMVQAVETSILLLQDYDAALVCQHDADTQTETELDWEGDSHAYTVCADCNEVVGE